ncbi:MAG: toxin-antitoxin system YwqK family antitoxin [Bacteroidota bacterium]|nr:toxin-antitoxin system YwqK family antitoxin [Bacteroidota bacterium]
MFRLGYIIVFLFVSFCAKAQIKHFIIHEGDTINVIDRDSLKQGVWREFYDGKKLKSETVYKNNKKQGLDISWYASGCVKQEIYYNNGQLDGPVTYYDKNCKKELIENYKNGVKEGIEITYYNNGRIKSEGNYKKGNLDGVYKIYTKTGKFNFESRTGTEPVTFDTAIEDTATNTVFRVLTRNPKWKKNIIVTDLTSSMYPYAKQINTWLKLYFMKDTAQQYFVFFNDGDNKKDADKKIGATGGIYICKAKTCEDLVNTMKLTIKKGEGGDSPENVVEAILAGIKKIRRPDNIVLIADNWAKVRDLSLITRVKIPVRVILCGVFEGMEINTDYLNIAYKTRGSLHTIEQDITELINQTSGKKFNINGFNYMIKNGNVIAN